MMRLDLFFLYTFRSSPSLFIFVPHHMNYNRVNHLNLPFHSFNLINIYYKSIHSFPFFFFPFYGRFSCRDSISSISFLNCQRHPCHIYIYKNDFEKISKSKKDFNRSQRSTNDFFHTRASIMRLRTWTLYTRIDRSV